MSKKEKLTDEQGDELLEQQQSAQEPQSLSDKKRDKAEAEQKSTLEQLKESVTEDDDTPIGSLTLRTILGGDILSATMVRRQVWLCLLIALFVTVYVAFRYQCQQDMIDIEQLEAQLIDAKYKALSSSSTLTERCRESHVLDMLHAKSDSTLMPSKMPPFKIEIPEEDE